MSKYKVTDYWNNIIYESDKLLYAKFLVQNISTRSKIYKNDKLLLEYWNGTEIDKEKNRNKFIKDFEKKMSFLATSDYYRYDSDYPDANLKLVEYMIKEIDYWISCVYEEGHCLNQLLDDEPSLVKRELNKIKKYKKELQALKKIIEKKLQK